MSFGVDFVILTFALVTVIENKKKNYCFAVSLKRLPDIVHLHFAAELGQRKSSGHVSGNFNDVCADTYSI